MGNNISRHPIKHPANYFGMHYCTHGGGKEHCHYVKSDDNFKKELKVYISEASSPIEKESRKQVQRIFENSLERSYSDGKDHQKNMPFDDAMTHAGHNELGAKYVDIDLAGKSLKDFLKKLPRYDIIIRIMDLSDNNLKEIPRSGMFKTLIVSGNPLNECLNEIGAKMQVLEATNCGIQELTPEIFTYFNDMFHISLQRVDKYRNFGEEFHREVLREVNFCGNPLSEKTIAMAIDYGKSGRDIPNIILNIGDKIVQTADLAKENKEKLVASIELERKINVEKAKIAKKETEEKNRVNGLLSYFKIEKIDTLSKERQSALINFMQGVFTRPASNEKLNSFVSESLNSIISEKELADIVFSNMQKRGNESSKLTFNLIKESILLWSVGKGEFDGASDDLKKELRNLFKDIQLEQLGGLKSVSSFTLWKIMSESELKGELRSVLEKHFKAPNKLDISRMNYSIAHAEQYKFQEWLDKNQIWQKYQRRMPLVSK